MSEQVSVARISRTGALIPIHDGNKELLLQPGVVEAMAEKDSETGRLVEVDGSDNTAVTAASNDLVRIGRALVSNKAQRETLLTSALKLPGAEEYLISLGTYAGAEDEQYIDPETLFPTDAGLPEQEVQITDVSEELAAAKEAEEGEAKEDEPEAVSEEVEEKEIPEEVPEKTETKDAPASKKKAKSKRKGGSDSDALADL